MKVVQTYGSEELEATNYKKYLSNSHRVTQSEIVKTAVGLGLIQFLMYLFYGYTLYFGGKLRNDIALEPDTEGDEYSGGDIIAIMFCVIIGAFGLGGGATHFKAVSDAMIAGKLAYDIMDHIPKVDPNTPGEMAVASEIKGQIEFRNVNFTYPTRQELKVLKNFSCVFEAGKTTALVGPSGSGKSTIVQLLERFYDPNNGSI